MTVEEINAKAKNGSHPSWRRPLEREEYANGGIELGDYLLLYYRDHKGDECYWIEHKSGEGMEVSRESLIDCIDKFYQENF